MSTKVPFHGYVFTKVNSDGTTVQFKIPDLEATHMELTNEFTRFLRASGYIFHAYAELALEVEDCGSDE